MRCQLILVCLIMTIGCSKNKHSEINTNIKKEQFIPKDWKILDSCSTDFNKDNIIDKVFVIQENKHTISRGNEECEGDSILKKEIIIRFGLGKEKYKTSLKTSKIFGKCNWGIQGTDAYSDISNRKNTFGITFTTGGTLRSNLSYYFRYQDNDWFLIGYDEITYQVPYEDKYIKEINFLTGKQITYEIIGEKKTNTKSTNIGKKHLTKLIEFDASQVNFSSEE